MARDNDRDESTERDRRFSRRTYLKGAAAATVAAVGIGDRVVAAQSSTVDIQDGEAIDPYLESIDDGEELVLPQGTYTFGGATVDADDWSVDGQGSTFDVQGVADLRLRGQNWSFGGVNLDVSGSNQVRAFPRGGPWRFHHVAWNGENTETNYLMQPEINTDGAEGVVDSVWFGSGTGIDPDTGEYWNESAIKGLSNVRGDLWIRNSYFYQNGAYLAPTDTSRAQTHTGTHNYENCYAEDCYLSFARIGVPTGGTCTVRNCTGVYNGDENVPPTASGVKRSRGPWVFYGDAVIEDCQLDYSGETAVAASGKDNTGAGTVTVQGGDVAGTISEGVQTQDVGSNPSHDPPEGCVTSPEEAYLGTTEAGQESGTDEGSDGSGDSGASPSNDSDAVDGNASGGGAANTTSGDSGTTQKISSNEETASTEALSSGFETQESVAAKDGEFCFSTEDGGRHCIDFDRLAELLASYR